MGKMSASGPQQKVNLSHHALQSVFFDRFSYEKCQILHKFKKASTENVNKKKKAFVTQNLKGIVLFRKKKTLINDTLIIDCEFS